jgi:hypothetical protein
VPTRQVVEGLFARVQARDWPRASDLVAEALTLGLPVARERFVGRDHFIRLQQEYPRWSSSPFAASLVAKRAWVAATRSGSRYLADHFASSPGVPGGWVSSD